MTDLQDRIAAVIQRWLDNNLDDLPDRYAEWIHTPTLAAAVVEELGLLSKEHSTVGWQGDRPIGLVRYVTDWEPT